MRKNLFILLIFIMLVLQGCSLKKEDNKETFLSIPEYNEKYSLETPSLDDWNKK